MENTINQRVSTLMDSQRLNINNFAKAIGKSYTALHGIVKGNSKPGFDLLEAIIATYPNINPSWLLTGDGEMFTDGSKKMPKSPESDSYLREHLRTLEENFARLAAQLEAKDKQLEAAGRTVEGLQRTVDALLVNMPGKPNDTSFPSRIIPLWPLKEKAAV